MADIDIVRQHQLGLPEARKIANEWVAQAESEYGMQCTWQKGADGDEVHFERSGVQGTLAVAAHQFAVNVKLGFLLGAFKDKIEKGIIQNLDALLASRTGQDSRKSSKS